MWCSASVFYSHENMKLLVGTEPLTKILGVVTSAKRKPLTMIFFK